MKFESPKNGKRNAGEESLLDGLRVPSAPAPEEPTHEERFGITKLEIFSGGLSVITPSPGWNADPTNISDFRAAVSTALLSSREVIIDLGADSLGAGKVRMAGLVELLEVYKAVSALGGRLALAVDPNGPASSQLRISHLDQALIICETLSQAKASMASDS